VECFVDFLTDGFARRFATFCGATLRAGFAALLTVARDPLRP